MEDVTAQTDREHVEVTVTRDPGGANEEFFRTTLYAYGGRVTLHDLDALIEEHWRSLGIISQDVRVAFDESAITFHAIHCNHVLPRGFDYRTNFWLVSSSTILHRNSAVALAHLDNGTPEYRVRVYMRSGGSVESTFSRQVDSHWVSFSVAELLEHVLSKAGAAIEDAAYFTIYHGTAEKTFYIAEDPYYLTFRFRNLFNAPEYLDLPCKLKRKTAVDSNETLCGRRYIQYDRVINKTYEVETGPLTSDQALCVEQLVSSYKVSLIGASGDVEIIITDHGCECDNDNDSLTTMHFTFRTVDARPNFLDDELDVPPISLRIFSNEFSAEFS